MVINIAQSLATQQPASHFDVSNGILCFGACTLAFIAFMVFRAMKGH